MECYECAICMNQMPYFTPQEMEHWSFVGKDAVLRRDFDGNTRGDPALEGEENIEVTPLSSYGPPVFVDHEHVFHEKCAREWCQKQGTAKGEQVYTKIFSKVLPCVKQNNDFKHTCPTCRTEILTSKFVVNTKLVFDPLKPDTYPEEMPFPDGFDGHYKIEEERPRKSMMEVTFLIVVLFITMFVIWISDFFGCSLVKKEPNERLTIRAASVFDINYEDFKGFYSIGEFFLTPMTTGDELEDHVPVEFRM